MRYVLIRNGEEIASAKRCNATQPVLIALLMIGQANDPKLEGYSWELPASQAKRIGRIYDWAERHDTLYGLPVRWTSTKEA